MSINQQLGLAIVVFMLGATAFLWLTSPRFGLARFAMVKEPASNRASALLRFGLPGAFVGGAVTMAGLAWIASSRSFGSFHAYMLDLLAH